MVIQHPVKHVAESATTKIQGQEIDPDRSLSIGRYSIYKSTPLTYTEAVQSQLHMFPIGVKVVKCESVHPLLLDSALHLSQGCWSKYTSRTWLVISGPSQRQFKESWSKTTWWRLSGSCRHVKVHLFPCRCAGGAIQFCLWPLDVSERSNIPLKTPQNKYMELGPHVCACATSLGTVHIQSAHLLLKRERQSEREREREILLETTTNIPLYNTQCTTRG